MVCSTTEPAWLTRRQPCWSWSTWRCATPSLHISIIPGPCRPKAQAFPGCHPSECPPWAAAVFLATPSRYRLIGLLVLPCSQGGDLHTALARDKSSEFSWHRAGRRVATDITRGLHFLHASGVVHRRACRLACSSPVHTAPLSQMMRLVQ